MNKQDTSVHPELQTFAARMPQFTFSSKNLWVWRLMDRVLWKRKTPPDISIEHVHIPRADGSSIRLRVYRSKAKNATAPAMVWMHGGGYIGGKPEQDDLYCIHFVREAGLVIVSVDYRYAPEHPFPSALEDCHAALTWIKANASQLGVDADRIAIGGESAGGGLAAALVQLAVDRKEVKPVFQLLIYPMLDDRTVLRSDLADRVYRAWNQESNRFGWESYLGRKCSAEAVPPYSVPARREDLSTLPPAWIGVGTLDLFHDEDVTYAKRLKECGVDCELTVVPGAFHGFDLAGMQVNVVRDFIGSQVDALKKNLG